MADLRAELGVDLRADARRLVDVDPRLEALVERLHRSTGMPPGVAVRVVDEVIDALSEPLEVLVRRRHRELRSLGERNEAIYTRIAAEVRRRPVAAPELTERQIRRLVYG